ncbi:anhydro-N-acetylmuramic acid kinase [Paenibacillus sp. PL2-23]|uniref:anhydro-N-acetylmuramic acid kinase n=1 Tax=Paenibacillus sp. PL2-23 TaxID=2100729 RepID=UPI0030F7ADCF
MCLCIDNAFVSGGGAHNAPLLRMLGELLLEQKLMTSGELGLADNNAKEAFIFALLGHDFLRGIPNNVPAATGADRRTVMGKLALP